MSESDILQTFAEVGVAIAGFTGVVFVLGNRAAGEWSRAERIHFRILLESSVYLVLFAILPVVLNSYLSTGASWRWSAGVLGVSFFGVVAGVWRRFWPHRQEFSPTFRRLLLANFPVTTLQGIACLLVALGYLSEFQGLIYLLVLLNCLASALFNFMYLLRSGLRSR